MYIVEGRGGGLEVVIVCVMVCSHPKKTKKKKENKKESIRSQLLSDRQRFQVMNSRKT